MNKIISVEYANKTIVCNTWNHFTASKQMINNI